MRSARREIAEEVPSATDSGEYDPVLDEIKSWEHLALEHYQPFVAADGLLNEFAMMWALCERFPLHTIVFKQTASHLPHEANIENLFSRAGLLSDPNMDPAFLGMLTSITVSRAACDPSYEAIKAKYFEKFRGKGGEDDEGDGGKAGPSGSEPGPSSSSQEQACELELGPFLPLCASPDSDGPLFTRTPTPTSPLANPYHSYSSS